MTLGRRGGTPERREPRSLSGTPVRYSNLRTNPGPRAVTPNKQYSYKTIGRVTTRDTSVHSSTRKRVVTATTTGSEGLSIGRSRRSSENLVDSTREVNVSSVTSGPHSSLKRSQCFVEPPGRRVSRGRLPVTGETWKHPRACQSTPVGERETRRRSPTGTKRTSRDCWEAVSVVCCGRPYDLLPQTAINARR